MNVQLSKYESEQVMNVLDLSINKLKECKYKDNVLSWVREETVKDLITIKDKFKVELNE